MSDDCKIIRPNIRVCEKGTKGCGVTHDAEAVNNIVTCEITYQEIMDMTPPVPYAVQIRQRLNRAGFKFRDDRMFSSIINESPEPLGTMSSWEDVETRSTYYRQILTT